MFLLGLLGSLFGLLGPRGILCVLFYVLLCDANKKSSITLVAFAWDYYVTASPQTVCVNRALLHPSKVNARMQSTIECSNNNNDDNGNDSTRRSNDSRQTVRHTCRQTSLSSSERRVKEVQSAQRRLCTENGMPILNTHIHTVDDRERERERQRKWVMRILTYQKVNGEKGPIL